MCKKCMKKKKSMGRRIGKADWMDFDFEDIAYIAAGGAVAKLAVNPLKKAIFDGGKYPTVKKYAGVIAKGLVGVGLNMINDRRAKQAAKGAIVAAVLEGLDFLAPKVFQPVAMGGYDDLTDAIEIDLADINGYVDDVVMGHGNNEDIVL